jgi:hypothetical protein
MTAWRPAWINDLQGGGLENGVFIGSQGRPGVERPLARLAGEKRVLNAHAPRRSEGGCGVLNTFRISILSGRKAINKLFSRNMEHKIFFRIDNDFISLVVPGFSGRPPA